MARDTFVRWIGPVPSNAAIGENLMAYLSPELEGQCRFTERSRRWVVDLPGTPEPSVFAQPSRWFEVVTTTEETDIITRQQDDFTNAVAQGFAQRIARRFNGKVDE